MHGRWTSEWQSAATVVAGTTSMASYGRGENAPNYGLEIGAVGMAAVAA